MTGLIFTVLFTSVNIGLNGGQNKCLTLILTVRLVAFIITLMHMICNKPPTQGEER